MEKITQKEASQSPPSVASIVKYKG